MSNFRFRVPLPSSRFRLFPLFISGCLADSSKKETTADTSHLAPVVTVTSVNTARTEWRSG